jgi:hypothetical protein
MQQQSQQREDPISRILTAASSGLREELRQKGAIVFSGIPGGFQEPNRVKLEPPTEVEWVTQHHVVPVLPDILAACHEVLLSNSKAISTQDQDRPR